jgi:hypothetical protein
MNAVTNKHQPWTTLRRQMAENEGQNARHDEATSGNKQTTTMPIQYNITLTRSFSTFSKSSRPAFRIRSFQRGVIDGSTERTTRETGNSKETVHHTRLLGLLSFFDRRRGDVAIVVVVFANRLKTLPSFTGRPEWIRTNDKKSKTDGKASTLTWFHCSKAEEGELDWTCQNNIELRHDFMTTKMRENDTHAIYGYFFRRQELGCSTGRGPGRKNWI